MRHYAPYTLPGFKFVPRGEDALSRIDGEDAQKLRILARTVDEKRGQDPYIGAKLAGREIYANLIEMLKTEKGVHIESLLAVIGAMGGYECMNGIMTALNAVLAEGVSLAEAGFALSVFVCETKSDEMLLLGDRAGKEFCTFYMTAARTSEPPFDKLKPLSVRAADTGGTPEYWKTPFDEVIGKSPRELSEMFRGKFEPTFDIFCVYPQERMMAWALAAQSAVEQAAKVISSDGFETSMSILAEYGWRTSHFIG